MNIYLNLQEIKNKPVVLIFKLACKIHRLCESSVYPDSYRDFV
jgi:hypothetical protein